MCIQDEISVYDAHSMVFELFVNSLGVESVCEHLAERGRVLGVWRLPWLKFELVKGGVASRWWLLQGCLELVIRLFGTLEVFD